MRMPLGGLNVENVAEKHHVTREEQDQFSVHSQLKAAQAKQKGYSLTK